MFTKLPHFTVPAMRVSVTNLANAHLSPGAALKVEFAFGPEAEEFACVADFITYLESALRKQVALAVYRG